MTAPVLTPGPRTGQASQGPAAQAPDQGSSASTGRWSARWQRWREPGTLILAGVILGGVLIALLKPGPVRTGYLDPASPAPAGAQALTDLLGERGATVLHAYSPAAAMSALRTAGPGQPASTLVITRPDLLTPGQLTLLGRARASLFLVEAGPAALPALAPGVFVSAYPGPVTGSLVRPDCSLPAALLAGSANVSGFSYQAPAGAAGCYRTNGSPALVRYSAAGRTVTVLGNGTPLSNGALARNGNAALALNLLAGQRRIVWLTPAPGVPPASAGTRHGSGQRVPGLLPTEVSLLILQLCIAVLIIVIWRARRFGPLISEELPVVVRASETVEGHARLYQSRRARDRAAAGLRAAMLGRLLPTLGLVRDSPPESVVAVLDRRSKKSGPEIGRILYGPTPSSDTELVDLARNLDELEREVRSQ